MRKYRRIVAKARMKRKDLFSSASRKLTGVISLGTGVNMYKG